MFSLKTGEQGVFSIEECSAVLEFKTIPKNMGASWWRLEEAAVQTASSQRHPLTPRWLPPAFIVVGSLYKRVYAQSQLLCWGTTFS